MATIVIAILVAWLIIKVVSWSPKNGSLVKRKLNQDAELLRGIAGLFRKRSDSKIIPFRLVPVLLFAAAIGTASGDDHERNHSRDREPNWIIERQVAGQVEGVPTSRRIIGRREIDVYPDGSMFEKGNYVGHTDR